VLPLLAGYLSSEAKALVRDLLEKDPKKRLGYGPDGSKRVMEHVFFKKINWARLANREIPSPFRPETKVRSAV
jgi:hypothetical protein